MLVSHDRAFLDNVTKRTIEITAGKIYDYKVSYSDYVVLMQQRRASQQALLTSQQREIAEIERFIERFRYKATKAKQVQSRIKRIEKMELANIDEVDLSTIHFQFPPAPHSGKVVLEINNLTKSYGNKEILSDISLLIAKGEKIAFVGRNGEGKSTLSKIIVGELTDYSGQMKLGHNVSIGYFAQNQAALLNPNLSVFDTIDQIAVGDVRKRIRTILGSFLFDQNDIEKKVKVLSGGEKSRLALAKLLLTPVNLLILDEPTNHLDIDSKNILKQALLRYDGTLILVSHDRDFLSGLSDTLYEFKDKKIKMYKGDVFDFLKMNEIEDLNALNLKKQESKEISSSANAASKASYQQSKEQSKAIRKIKSNIEKTEAHIEHLEARIADMDAMFHDEQKAFEVANDKEFIASYNNLKAELAASMEQWEQLQTELAQSSE
ncbi:MAG: ABC-F family ATP-binding cassette domain-containing protein [Bacteroidales bacterium]|nr:ABC-F family ATP-binding cassette domain-containing protein [Bacteroidales bacterium]